jgi:hypothetical protein
VVPPQVESILDLGYQFVLVDCPAGIDVGFINAISPAKEAVVGGEAAAARPTSRRPALAAAQGRGGALVAGPGAAGRRVLPPLQHAAPGYPLGTASYLPSWLVEPGCCS